MNDAKAVLDAGRAAWMAAFRLWMHNSGTSAAHLVEAVPVSRSLLSHWERGKRFPSRDMLLRIEELSGGTVRADLVPSRQRLASSAKNVVAARRRRPSASA